MSQAYRASFATLCAGTIPTILDDLADARPGRILDVGCGAGDLLAEAERRGLDRDAVGLDADPAMIGLTRARGGCPVAIAALPDLPFDASTFDFVIANFVINHVPDPRASVAELKRVTAADGRVALTIWPANGSGWGQFVHDAFTAAGVTPQPSGRLPEAMDFPRSVEGLGGIAREAGLGVVTAREVRWVWRISVEDLLTGICGGVGAAGMTYLSQSPQVQSRVRDEFRARARHTSQDDHLHFDAVAAYILARV